MNGKRHTADQIIAKLREAARDVQQTGRDGNGSGYRNAGG